MNRLQLICIVTMAAIEASMIVEEEDCGHFTVSHILPTF